MEFWCATGLFLDCGVAVLSGGVTPQENMVLLIGRIMKNQSRWWNMGTFRRFFFPPKFSWQSQLDRKNHPKELIYTGVIKYGEIPEEHEHFKGKSSHYFWFSSHGALLTLYFGYSAGIRQFNITGYINSSQTEVYIVEAADTFAALVGENYRYHFQVAILILMTGKSWYTLGNGGETRQMLGNT